MAALALDAPDMQPLILSLTADVRLIHLNDTRERRRNLRGHEYAKAVRHALCRPLAYSRLRRHTLLRPFAKERSDGATPYLFRETESADRVGVATELPAARPAFMLFATDNP